MQLVRRFRIPALLCSLAVLLCELISRPYAETGICDDGPYILMARHLADTGHIVFNGWAAPMLGWQLYLGAAFVKLFSFSLTTVRMSTLLVAVVMAWLLQRTMALAGINERNAMLGTLAFVLSPLYLMLSVTYMSDIFGLFAVVICLYGCLRALQASTDRAAIAWLCFAVATNALFGTARQIAWLGLLVMVPSALYVLGLRGGRRARQKLLWAGGAATTTGGLFIFACMQWLRRQPYSIPEHLMGHGGSGLNLLSAFLHTVLGFPFLLLPLAILFVPDLCKDLRRSVKAAAIVLGTCILALLVLHLTHAQDRPVLEPVLRDWVTIYDGFGGASLKGTAPIFLHTGACGADDRLAGWAARADCFAARSPPAAG
ncbi:MAG: ArnT family glycosyltransferase [Acidobacteriaceae bacterium]